MQERGRTEETIEFVFTKAPDYRVISANGIWGGVTPRGALKMDFTLDSQRTPDSVVHSVTPEGGLGPEIDRKPTERAVSRELQVGILLSIEHAENVASWILDKVKEAKARVGEGGEGS